jgi:hypothetical protein
MNGASTDAFATVVRSESKRVFTAGDAKIVPIKIVRAGFVGYPLALCVPEGTGLEANDLESCASETLKEDAAGGANADDGIVDHVGIVEMALGDLNLLERTKMLEAVVFRGNAERATKWGVGRK